MTDHPETVIDCMDPDSSVASLEACATAGGPESVDIMFLIPADPARQEDRPTVRGSLTSQAGRSRQSSSDPRGSWWELLTLKWCSLSQGLLFRSWWT